MYFYFFAEEQTCWLMWFYAKYMKPLRENCMSLRSWGRWRQVSHCTEWGYLYSLPGTLTHAHTHTHTLTHTHTHTHRHINTHTPLCVQCKRQQWQLMRTIFVPSQRSRSPSHNCQSCNKSLFGTNEYCIGNETKLIGMLCQLDSIHPPFHTRPFICEVMCGSVSFTLSISHLPSPTSL